MKQFLELVVFACNREYWSRCIDWYSLSCNAFFLYTPHKPRCESSTTEPFRVDNFSFLILFCQEIKTNMKHLIPIDLVNEWFNFQLRAKFIERLVLKRIPFSDFTDQSKKHGIINLNILQDILKFKKQHLLQGFFESGTNAKRMHFWLCNRFRSTNGIPQHFKFYSQ